MNELPTTHKEGDNKGEKRGKQDAEGRHTRGTELSWELLVMRQPETDARRERDTKGGEGEGQDAEG